MDKLIKKMSLMLSSVLMILTFSVPVFAKTIPTPSIGGTAPENGSITITKEGAVFTGYQVLKATQSGDAFEYSATENFKNFFDNPTYGSYKVDQVKNLKEADAIKEFASQLHKYVIDTNVNSGITINSGEKKEVGLGYYLVLETAGKSTGNAVASTAILTSVPQVSDGSWNYNVVINPKDNTPQVEKKIVSEDGSLVDTSSANIGDTIKYQVNASIPTYEKNATGIVYKFKDTMSKGLTYDAETGFTITSTSGSKTFEKGVDYEISNKTMPDGTTEIEVTFVYDNIKGYASEGLKLQYQATLNEKAIVKTEANEGNPNNITLEYTNNPDLVNDNKTLEDKVTSYTWGFAVKKVDADDIYTDLAGAEFSVKDAEQKVIGKYTYNEHGQVVVLDGNATTNSEGLVTFTGLKEGDYYITEEKAPKGYSILKEPVKVTITPEKSGGNYTGKATIEVTNGNTAGSITTDITMEDQNILFNVQIKNYAGVSLPGTGGIGTNGFVKIAIGLLAVVVVLGVGYIAIDKAKQA
ncbi:SpaH/EbpB family LPXTG-anchored major pilin (plasmid) [Clostridium perfringens]|uniref:SpaH/EbpB family LPXTG-anchored major pilin n=1 Tax=Clostridium perfringens TaxID=1502 RepID=UPI0012423A38|nr:SpaH/EbpB family LPXTG-anchored major pilin [Clostridium perfringens]ELC8371439.1 SpaH/EbpB family LPXTG-anchored major pilin [Clostridium perfringens]MDJ8959830.1 SpaH/EbpB family LPXTG-anchored major pilin [Clostridium perfringens]